MKLKKLSAAALAALTVTMMSAVPVLAADDIEVNEDIPSPAITTGRALRVTTLP